MFDIKNGARIKDIEEVLRNTDLAADLLKERYADCDSGGHHAPDNPKEGICGHCYRHLEYRSARVDAINESRRGLSFWEIPMDAPVILEMQREDIGFQKGMDWLTGVTELTYLIPAQKKANDRI